MTPKDRMIYALNFKQPDDLVPCWEIEFHLYEELLGKPLLIGNNFDILSEYEKEKATYYNAEMYIEAAKLLNFSAITVPPGYWEVSPGIPAFLWIRDLRWRVAFTKALKDISGDDFYIIGFSDTGVGIPSGEKLDAFVTMMYEEPGDLIKLAEKQLSEGIEEGTHIVDAGADALLNTCDIAFNSGCFFTPAQFDHFIGPYLEKWTSHFRSEGITTIYHTDGDISKIMDKLISTGINAIQCIDPIAGMDIVKLKEKYQGKITLVGNVDTRTLEFGTPEEIESECRYILEGSKKDGGFVFGACNAIYKGIPIEKYKIMTGALLKYGSYR